MTLVGPSPQVIRTRIRVTDPAERTNLAEHHPEKTRELLHDLETWEATAAPTRWHDGRDWRHWQEVSVQNHRINPN